MGRDGKVLLLGRLAGFLVRARKFICLHAFLFACLHATCSNKIMGIEGITNAVHKLVQFYEEHTSPFLEVKYVTIEAALVNCIVLDPLQSTMNPHDSEFM